MVASREERCSLTQPLTTHVNGVEWNSLSKYTVVSNTELHSSSSTRCGQYIGGRIDETQAAELIWLPRIHNRGTVQFAGRHSSPTTVCHSEVISTIS